MNTVAKNTTNNNNTGETVMKHELEHSELSDALTDCLTTNHRSKRMMKIITGLTILAVGGMLIGFAPGSHAANFYWNGNGSSWTDNANWQDSEGGAVTVYPGELGTENDYAYIPTAGANVNLSDSVSLIRSGGTLVADDARLLVGSTTAGIPATLNISANVTASWLQIGNTADYAHGVVHHTSGSITARLVRISGGGSGEYHFGSTDVNTAPSANFAYNVPTTTGNWQSQMFPTAGNTALLSLSGYGEFKGQSFRVGSAGGVEVRVQGGNLDINFSDPNHATRLGNNTTYTAIIDDTGISTWNAADLRFMGTENLNFKLELDESFTFVLNQKFTILSANNFFADGTAGSINSGTFTNVAHGDIIGVGGYKFLAEYYYGTGKDTFTLTAIPEPSSVLLMLLGGLGLLKRR